MLQEWLDQLPHPGALRKAKQEMEGLPTEIQLEMIQEARETDKNWPPRLLEQDDDRAVRILFSTPKGQLKFVSVILGVDESRAADLLDKMVPDDFAILTNAAFDFQPQYPLDDALVKVANSADLNGRDDIANQADKWLKEVRDDPKESVAEVAAGLPPKSSGLSDTVSS